MVIGRLASSGESGRPPTGRPSLLRIVLTLCGYLCVFVALSIAAHMLHIHPWISAAICAVLGYRAGPILVRIIFRLY